MNVNQFFLQDYRGMDQQICNFTSFKRINVIFKMLYLRNFVSINNQVFLTSYSIDKVILIEI